MIDIEFIGHRFTWRGPIYNGGIRIYERLDRDFCNDIWRHQFPDACVKVLSSMEFSYDHIIISILGRKMIEDEKEGSALKVLGTLRESMKIWSSKF